MSASLNVLLSTIYQAIVSILSPLPYDIMLLLSPPILLTATIIFSLAMSVCLWDTEWRSTAGSRHGMFARSIMGVGMGSFYNGSQHGMFSRSIMGAWDRSIMGVGMGSFYNGGMGCSLVL